MTSDNVIILVAMIVAVIIVFTGLLSGKNIELRRFKNEAVSNNFAHWKVIDNSNGKTEFCWNTNR